MPGWGSVAHLEDKPEPESRVPSKQPMIVFATSDDISRSFAHKVSEEASLVRLPIRIVHRGTAAEFESLIPGARLIVIATCRESLNKDSVSQEQEKLVGQIAVRHRKKIILLCGDDQEAVQHHLGLARSLTKLVITPLRHGISEGYRDSFPMASGFVGRLDDVPDYYPFIAETISTHL